MGFKRRHVWWTLGMLPVLGFIGLRACILAAWDTSFRFDQVSVEQLAQCEKLMQLEFPASTVAEGMFGDSWQDTTIHLKVSMAASELAAFIASSPFASATLDTDRRQVFRGDGDPSWWNPDRVDPFESGSVDLREGREGLRVLIGHDADRAIVYLLWFDT